MADKLSSEARSENMRRIRGKDTRPELTVRRFLHRHGLRYRLHVRTMAGKPDLVFPSRKVCVFVHGCFWHGCTRCIDGTRRVKSNSKYWKNKVAMNTARDKSNTLALRTLGWNVIEIWECQTKDERALRRLTEQIRANVRTNMPGI